MNNLETMIALLILSSFIGAILGYFFRYITTISKKNSIEIEVKQLVLSAKEEAQKIKDKAKNNALKQEEKAKKETQEREIELKNAEKRLIRREDLLDSRQIDLDKEIENIKKKIEGIKEIKEQVDIKNESIDKELSRISELSQEDAKNELLEKVEKKEEKDLIIKMRKLEEHGEEKLDRKAKDILSMAVQRLASSTASNFMTTSVQIPNDEIKGKIIGKEGRNIRAFERVAGVELIVDDTPGTVIISSFDSVRRQIARIALENLIMDGRIQPVKIEEVVKKAREDINKIIKEKGESAAFECSVYNLDPRVLSILGRLYFRTSYGQNVLQHSIEMSHISGIIAEELGADVQVAKAGALLHDIGKAVDHEIQGTHVEIGRRILQKFGVDEQIVKAMQAHHGEYPYETVESVIVQTADSISGGRPGARRDSVENYIKRLRDLESIASSFKGVNKAYALQAGRELRVFVTPEEINDFEAKKLAHEIASHVEEELKYPGEIKVCVIRESRTIDYAR